MDNIFKLYSFESFYYNLERIDIEFNNKLQIIITVSKFKKNLIIVYKSIELIKKQLLCK